MRPRATATSAAAPPACRKSRAPAPGARAPAPAELTWKKEDSPKSVALSDALWVLSESRKFSGLRSRWMTPCVCVWGGGVAVAVAVAERRAL